MNNFFEKYDFWGAIRNRQTPYSRGNCGFLLCVPKDLFQGKIFSKYLNRQLAIESMIDRVKSMRSQYVLSMYYARHLWQRADLPTVPRGIQHVAEVLHDAGIKVFEVDSISGMLMCEPRPMGVKEALTGKFCKPHSLSGEYPPEQPGKVLELLAEKGVQVEFEQNITSPPEKEEL